MAISGQARCKLCKTMKDCTLCEKCWLWLCPEHESQHRCAN
jgi:hypothetical protein